VLRSCDLIVMARPRLGLPSKVIPCISGQRCFPSSRCWELLFWFFPHLAWIWLLTCAVEGEGVVGLYSRIANNISTIFWSSLRFGPTHVFLQHSYRRFCFNFQFTCIHWQCLWQECSNRSLPCWCSRCVKFNPNGITKLIGGSLEVVV
jgi:hypothetical protein